MIGTYLYYFWLSLVDVVRAGFDFALRRSRSGYSAVIDIAASRAVVWDLLTRPKVTYLAAGMESVQEPIPGRDDAYVAAISVRGRPALRVACAYVVRDAPVMLKVRYLRELCEPQRGIGSDDAVTFDLGDDGRGGTRLRIVRELTHLIAATRITAPLGARQAAWLIKSQAEHEAGCAVAKPSIAVQGAWAAAALASFFWLFGWGDGFVLAAIIAVHEIGHAIAMLWFGLGVRMISFVPFFGGVAMPRRYYRSEWERGVVALMGTGFSLPFTVALAALAQADAAGRLDLGDLGEAAGHASVLSAFVNGFNLVPLPGLDGGIVTQLLMRRLPRIYGRMLGLLLLAALVAFAVMVNSPIMWIAVAFSGVAFVQMAALRVDEQLPRAGWPAWWGLLVLFVGLLTAYIAIGAGMLDY